MKQIIALLFLLVLLWGKDAETLYLSNGCPNCHGFYGQGTSSGPRLQNKKEALLLRRLQDLQKGIARTPEGEIMIPFSKSMDANQTKAMAHYPSIIRTSYQNRDCINDGEYADGRS